eukprot:TRINITY_DN9820_c0_g1_i1.p1 TRINITY_DN9820_c0_g1~~TRINITY_DN9820_c0_g1_i1.p1  ORF type:complete len:571 (+),score=189.68 TRINITY_DN9820_c0_g1_i1:74-1786(+)
MPKKKSFNKKNATTFHLVHRPTESAQDEDVLDLTPVTKPVKAKSTKKSDVLEEEYYDHEQDAYGDEYYDDEDDEWEDEEGDEDDDDYYDEEDEDEETESEKQPSSSKNDASGSSSRKKPFRYVTPHDKDYSKRDFELGEYGFPDDGYDYTKHLRIIGKGRFIPATSVELMAVKQDKNIVKFKDFIEEEEQKSLQSQKAEKAPIPPMFQNDVFVKDLIDQDATRESVEALRQIDPEVLALLEDDFEEEVDELQDDFVVQASEGKLYDRPKGKGWDDLPMGINPEMLFRGELERLRNMHAAESGKGRSRAGQSGYEDEDDDDDIYDDEDYEDRKGRRYETGSVTSSMRSSGLIDEKFEKIAQEFDDDQIGELDGEDPEVQGTSNIDNFEDILDDFLESRRKLKYDEVIRKYEKETHDETSKELHKRIVEQYEHEEEQEKKEVLYVEEERDEKWDCETILSTYSNMDNHPKIIGEDAPKKILLSRKTGIPLNVLQTKPTKEESSDEERENLGVPRPKKETAEEKRNRKKQLKDAKKERRQDKKFLKEAFKQEELKQAKLASQPAFGKSIQRLA